MSEAPAEALPGSIGALVDAVVSRTRLRRAEREDIRAELESHFREALGTGKSAEEAVALFGDPKLAARAMRAAALRKRSPLDRAFRSVRNGCAWMLAGVAVAYVGFWVYLGAQGVTISFDPLQRMASLAPQAESPDDVAWPRIRDALVILKLGRAGPPGGLPSGASHPAGEAGWPGRAVPGAGEWSAQEAWCDANQEGIALLRDASRLPVLGFPIATGMTDADRAVFGDDAVDVSQQAVANTDQPFRAMGILLPHVSPMRGVAKVLALDATVAASRGDGTRAVADIEAMIGLSMLNQQPRVLIVDLVAIAIRSLACSRALMLLEDYPDAFSDADLMALQEAMRAVPESLSRMDLSGERVFFEDVVQCTYTDDGNGDGWFNPSGTSLEVLQGVVTDSSARDGAGALLSPLAPLVAISQASRSELMSVYDEWIEEMEGKTRLPLAEIHANTYGRVFSRLENDPVMQARYRLLWLLLPAVDHAHVNYAAERATRQAVDATAAAIRFSRAHGRWPVSAEELAPEFIPEVPLDPWSIEPTAIRVAGQGAAFRMWSIGPDGADDGGRIPEPDGSGRANATTTATSSAQRRSDLDQIDWIWYSAGGDLSRWFEESR